MITQTAGSPCQDPGQAIPKHLYMAPLKKAPTVSVVHPWSVNLTQLESKAMSTQKASHWSCQSVATGTSPSGMGAQGGRSIHYQFGDMLEGWKPAAQLKTCPTANSGNGSNPKIADVQIRYVHKDRSDFLCASISQFKGFGRVAHAHSIAQQGLYSMGLLLVPGTCAHVSAPTLFSSRSSACIQIGLLSPATHKHQRSLSLPYYYSYSCPLTPKSQHASCSSLLLLFLPTHSQVPTCFLFVTITLILAHSLPSPNMLPVRHYYSYSCPLTPKSQHASCSSWGLFLLSALHLTLTQQQVGSGSCHLFLQLSCLLLAVNWDNATVNEQQHAVDLHHCCW